ncbi:TatD family hydrolase [Roseomonas sp. GC11]|uniref:TatD family hydrolase n=1 Tax=Roseomonas sp. GC11 TaxID=2950546 RepID=UPI002109A0FD|nr:TatD family hydrolase [Roseomonas sp. GC11]MCQ4159143.1 TatD family hydrolase [Roseomonas sp. GC11]
MLVDSHCHLDYFTEAEIEDILARAAAAGVGRMVTIGVRMSQAETVKALAERFPQVWGTVGVHPQSVGEAPLPTVEEIVSATQHPRIIGIGESGLDYFYDKAPRAVQQEGFRRHIRAAQATQLPLVIHARDADEDILALLKEEKGQGGDFPFLLHCFSSGRKLAEEALDLGGYVSLSGILTFPKSQEIRDIARDVPMERLLVETDSPYLAPVPFRGKRNEPSYVAHTARVLAEVKQVSPEELARITTENFFRLFQKAR